MSFPLGCCKSIGSFFFSLNARQYPSAAGRDRGRDRVCVIICVQQMLMLSLRLQTIVLAAKEKPGQVTTRAAKPFTRAKNTLTGAQTGNSASKNVPGSQLLFIFSLSTSLSARNVDPFYPLRSADHLACDSRGKSISIWDLYRAQLLQPVNKTDMASPAKPAQERASPMVIAGHLPARAGCCSHIIQVPEDLEGAFERILDLNISN